MYMYMHYFYHVSKGVPVQAGQHPGTLGVKGDTCDGKNEEKLSMKYNTTLLNLV